MPVVAEDVHIKLAPEGVDKRVIPVVEPPEHTVCGVIAFTAGFGFTVTINVLDVPLQLLRVGVMVYVTVPLEIAAVLKVWTGIFPVPLTVFPVMAAVAADVHAKLAPFGIEASTTADVDPPEQTV